MVGHGLLSRSVTIYFRADCSAALRGSNLGVIYVTNPKVRGFFRLEKTGLGGFLVVFTVGDINEPGSRFVADTITDDMAVAAGARCGRRPRPRRQIVLESTSGGRSPRRPTTFQSGRIFWPATPPTRCPQPAASAATPASRTRTTSPGSWRSCYGNGRARAGRHLRPGTPAGRRAGDRAGLQPLRDPLRSRPRHRGNARAIARHARGVQPLSINRGHPRRGLGRRRHVAHRSASVTGPPGNSRSSCCPPARWRNIVDARSLQRRLRADVRAGWDSVGGRGNGSGRRARHRDRVAHREPERIDVVLRRLRARSVGGVTGAARWLRRLESDRAHSRCCRSARFGARAPCCRATS